MGRWSKGVDTVKSAKRINISDLKKWGFLTDNQFSSGQLSWSTNGKQTSSIGVTSILNDDEQYIRLNYSTTFDYRIDLESIPSNLGKGKVWFFLCPETGKRCRLLYMGNDSLKFLSRYAYEQKGCRLYYEPQLSSKLSYPNDRYWELKRRLEKWDTKNMKFFYRGKPTRTGERYMKMVEEMQEMDRLRWSLEYMPKSLRNAMVRH